MTADTTLILDATLYDLTDGVKCEQNQECLEQHGQQSFQSSCWSQCSQWQEQTLNYYYYYYYTIILTNTVSVISSFSQYTYDMKTSLADGKVIRFSCHAHIHIDLLYIIYMYYPVNITLLYICFIIIKTNNCLQYCWHTVTHHSALWLWSTADILLILQSG